MTPSNMGCNRHLFDCSRQLQPPMLPSILSISRIAYPINPSIFEYFLSETSSSYQEKVNAIEILPIQQVPKSHSGRYQSFANTYPTITFEPRQIRQYLCTELARYPLDIWIGGSSVHPSDLSFNDIDYKIYINGFDYHNMIDHCLYKFIEQLIRKAGCSQSLNPLIIKDLYYNDRTLFRDKNGTVIGAQYAIGEVSFTLFYDAYPHYHSLSPADGVQYHPVRQVCRFSLGQRFATSEAEALYALNCAMYRQYDILSIENSRDAIFRIVFKLTQEHRIDTITIKKAIYKWKQEYTSSERIKKFGKHQLIHYPHQAGKVIDFLNFLSLLSEEDDFHRLAQDWILTNADSEIGKKLNFGYEQEFAKLILRDPSVAPHILNVFRGVFLLAWANQKIEQKPFISAYEFSFRKNSKDVRYSFSLSIDKHVYHLKLLETLPTQIATSYLESLLALKSKFNESFSSAMEILKPAITCLGIDPSYLIFDSSVLVRHLTAAFDMPTVKQVLFSSFKDHLKDIYETLSQITNIPSEQLAFIRKSLIANLKCRSEMMNRMDPSFQKCFKLICDYSEYIDCPSSTTITNDLRSLNTLLPNLCKNSVFQTAGFTDLLKLALPKLMPSIMEKLLFQTSNLEVLEQIKSLCHLPLDFEFITREESQKIAEKILQIESSLVREEKYSDIDKKEQIRDSILAQSEYEAHSPLMTKVIPAKLIFDTSPHLTVTKENADCLVSKLKDATPIVDTDIDIADIDNQFIHNTCHYLLLSLKKGQKKVNKLDPIHRISLETSIQQIILALAGTFTIENIRFAQAIFNQSRRINLFDLTTIDGISFVLIRTYAYLAIKSPEINNFKFIKGLISGRKFQSEKECLVLLTLIKHMLKQDALQQSFAISCLLAILQNESLEDDLYEQMLPVVYSCIYFCIEKSEDYYNNALSIFITFSKHIRKIADQFSDDIHSILLEIFCQSLYPIREKHVEDLDKILINLKAKDYFTDSRNNYPIIEAIQRTNIRQLYTYIPFYFFNGLNTKDPHQFLMLIDYTLWFNSRSESSKLDPISYELINLYIPTALEVCREPTEQRTISDCIIKIYARSGSEYALRQVYDFFVRRGWESDHKMSIYLLNSILLYPLNQDSLLLGNAIVNLVKQIMIYDNYQDSSTNKVIQEHFQRFFTQLTSSGNERAMEIAHRLLDEYVCLYKDKIDKSSLFYIFSLLYLPRLCLLDETFHTKYNRFKTILTQEQLKLTNTAVGIAQREHFTIFSNELEIIKRSINASDITIRKKRLQAMGLEIIKMISSYKDYCSNDDQKEELMYKFLDTYSKVFNKHLSSDIHYLTIFIETVIRDEVFMVNEYYYNSTRNTLVSNRIHEGLDKFLIRCMDLVLDSSASESTHILMNCLKELSKTKDADASFFTSLGKYHQSLASDKVLLMFLKGRRELQEYFDFIQSIFNHFKSKKDLLAINLHLAGITYLTHRLRLYPILLKPLIEVLNKRLIKSKRSQFNHIQQLLNRSVGTTGAMEIEKILLTFNSFTKLNFSLSMDSMTSKKLSEELARGIFLCKNQSEFDHLLSPESIFYATDFNQKFDDLGNEYLKFLKSMKTTDIQSQKSTSAMTTIMSHHPSSIATPEVKVRVDTDVPSDAHIDDLLSNLSNAIQDGFAESNATSITPSIPSKKKKKKKKKKKEANSGIDTIKPGTKSFKDYKEGSQNSDSDTEECKKAIIISK